MKCFYHHTSDAVGVCRGCERGLCPECITEYPEGLACKGRCEEAVSEIILLLHRNRKAIAKVGASRYLLPGFLIDAQVSDYAPRGLGLGFGSIFMVVGVFYLVVVKRVFRA